MERKLLLLIFTFSLNCKIGNASMLWGSKTDDKTVLVADGVPLVSIPYDSMTEDEKFLQEAAKFTDIQISSPLDTCRHKVVMKIRTSCSDMSEEELAKLGVNLLNCQSAVEGRKMFPCVEDMSLKQCTIDMDADMWNAYRIMRNRVRAVCYAARNTQFRALTELTVNKLMQSAHSQIEALDSLKQNQDRLEEQTTEALLSLNKGNKVFLEQREYLKDAQATAHKLVTTNLKELYHEKALIRSGHAQLAVMTEEIRNKLENAHNDLEQQAIERGENHREVLQDLINTKGSNGRTLLHLAAKYGHLSIVEYLMNEEKVDVNAKDNKGEIPLYYAVKYGNLGVTEYLIEKFSIKNGYTPLHWAAENGNLDTVKYLVDEKKIDVNIRDRNRYAPLHYAAQNGKLDIVKYLTGEKKADLDVKDKYGETPVRLASKNNHLDTVEYLVNEANLGVTDKHIYTLGKVNNEVGHLKLLGGKGEIIDRVIGIVNIAFGIKDILQEFGILPDKQSENFEKVLNAIGKNYAAIEEVGNKVDRNFVAMKVIFEMVSKTLSTIEETRIEMRQGFKRVLESIKELQVGDKISSLITFMDDYIKNIDVVKELSPNVRVAELERSGGILDKLRNAVTSEGILHGNLYHIINLRLAIPNDAEDNLAFATLHVLFYGVQTYVSEMFFVLEQYSYLADYYYQKGDIEKCNEYFDFLQISFNDFKGSLLRYRNKKHLIDKVTDILREVQGLSFVRNKREDVFELLQKRIDSLNLVTQKLQEMTLPIVADQPKVIMRKPDFSKSEVKTPIGEWKYGAKVSYAIQYKDNNTYSKIGEWSNAFTVYEKANPFLKMIPVDPQRRTRLIFRKFNSDKPELVYVIEDKYQTDFRDISRDLYDAALSSNEGIARKEVEVLLRNGAKINEAYENGRRAIHAAAQSGNSQIASDFLIKNNATDINVKDVNGYTPIYIAAEAGYEDFVKFSISNGADVNIKTNSDNFTPLHISAYNGGVSTVEVLMQSDKIDMNARDKMGFTPLHSAVFGGTYVVNTLSLSNNTDINAKSKEGLTPLHLASINDFEDIAESLLKNNEVDINAEANGNLTALHFASSMGNLKVVKFLVTQNKTNINAKSADGWTPLYFAAFLKKEDTALELLKVQNIEVNVKGKNNITPLHVATVTGQQNVISSLLTKGALTEEKTQDSLTALHLAAMHNKCEIIPILIDNGANIEAKTINGSTPLHLASFAGSSNSTSVLLNRGADTKLYDNNGYIPVHVAILNGKNETVKVLVEYEDDLVNVTDKNGEFPLHLAAKTGYVDIINCLVNNKVDINVRNNAGETPLHYAAKNDNSYAIETLAEKGAGLNIKDNSGWAPLHWAARDNCPDAIKAFAEKKANLTIRDNDSFAPLHLAARYNCSDAIKAFAEVGVDLNIRDKDGNAPLHFAADNDIQDVLISAYNLVKLLVEKGADVNVKNNNGNTPLHLAVIKGDLDTVKYLVEKGTNINARDDNPLYGGTPLNYAVVYGHTDIIMYLVTIGADVNAKDVLGTTTLHCAVDRSSLDIVKLLVEKGADVNARGMLGRTPLFNSAINCQLDKVEFLSEKGADVNTRDDYGYTPVSFITTQIIPRLGPSERGCYLDMVKYLKSRSRHRSVEYFIDQIERGDGVNVQDNDSGIPLHYSAIGGYSDVVRYLKSKGARRSFYNDNSAIEGNQAASGASKPSSWINNLVE